eukprot:5517799-Lingulodinium_polyedra.AAC.1
MGRHSLHHAAPGLSASPDLQTASTGCASHRWQRCAKRRAVLLRRRAAEATPPARSLSAWYAAL